MIDLFHELSQAMRHRLLLAIDAKASMVGTDVDLPAFNDMSPMAEGILGG